MPSLAEGFDDYSWRNGGDRQFAHQGMRRITDNIPASDFTSQYPEVSCHDQPPAIYGQQPRRYPSCQTNSSLPSFREVHQQQDRTNNGLGGGYNVGSIPYTHGYGYGYPVGLEPDNGTYTSRRQPILGYSQRNQPESYSSLHGSHLPTQQDQFRFVSTPYEPAGRHPHYQTPYVDLDYTASLNTGTDYGNFGALGESADPRNKRRKGNLPKPVTSILRAWLDEHLDHPYPSEEDKQMFMARTGLSMSQVWPS